MPPFRGSLCRAKLYHGMNLVKTKGAIPMSQRPLFFSLLSLSILVLTTTQSFANVPQIVGLGGGGTAGVPKDALFSNPAAVVGLTKNRAFFSYSQSKIRDLGAGGRIWATGVYDGSSKAAKGGITYIRESRRRLVAGSSPYLDSQTVRGVLGKRMFGGIMMGLTVNYKMKKQNEDTENVFVGDAGLIYPVSKGFPAGLKVENVTDKEGERPRTVTLGTKYRVSGPLTVVADFGRTVSEFTEVKNLWSLAAEVTLFKELILRGSLFKDSIDSIRGKSVGASWNGPRTSFEYALRITNGAPRERDHVLGVSLMF